ncbi:MAG: hypothetical protein AAF849_21970 [Bacteroidota bacterium]
MKKFSFILLTFFLAYSYSVLAQESAEFSYFKKMAGTWVADLQDDNNQGIADMKSQGIVALKWELTPILNGLGYTFISSAKTKDGNWMTFIEATHAYDK